MYTPKISETGKWTQRKIYIVNNDQRNKLFILRIKETNNYNEKIFKEKAINNNEIVNNEINLEDESEIKENNNNIDTIINDNTPIYIEESEKNDSIIMESNEKK